MVGGGHKYWWHYMYYYFLKYLMKINNNCIWAMKHRKIRFFSGREALKPTTTSHETAALPTWVDFSFWRKRKLHLFLAKNLVTAKQIFYRYLCFNSIKSLVKAERMAESKKTILWEIDPWDLVQLQLLW